MINVNSDLQNYFSTNIGEISQIRSENKLLSPVVNAYPVYEDDEDDYPYKYIANISFYLDSSDKNNDINSVDIMLFFRTQFSGTINLAFQSYVWVNINSAVGISQANAIGDVYFNQKTPIYAGSYTKETYDYSPFQTENGEYFSQISDIVYNNYNRNGNQIKKISFKYVQIVFLTNKFFLRNLRV
ncbi:hypothetical protein PPERSA_03128 [Pseudocohnilembus persalinus]|uniref:Uncharacterized protein n=1 Tax=Pseudocohnilembus persalinus TaxID=266149 RepID=A0A0V0QIK6_PSEPJ|nr:hypothetical protein PPERSA_03128 [Pseudocohnilembus persalinus]|eukprot:KRX02066.1 hypothetical protein PPERSA_03128 [Pseudocohnilembus persalinus]